MDASSRGYYFLTLLGAAFLCGLWWGKAQRQEAGRGRPAHEIHASDSAVHKDGERRPARLPDVLPQPAGDFQTQIQSLAQIANPMKRSRLMTGIADGLTAEEIKAALGSLEKTALTRGDAGEVRNQLLARLARLDFDAAWKTASGGGSDEMEGAVGALMSALVESNPSAAKAMVEGLPPSGARNQAWRCFVQEMALSDPKGAFELARKHGVAFGRDLFEQWANRSPAEALAAGQQLTDRRERASALQAALRVWAENDLPLALAWAESAETAEDGSHRSVADGVDPKGEVLKIWMKREQSEAVRWLEQLPAGKKRESMLASLSSEATPEAAITLAALMQAGRSRDSVLTWATSRLASRDPEAAITWAKAQDDEEVRKSIIPPLLAEIAKQDLARAIEMAEQMDGNERIPALQATVSAWGNRDGAAAAAWVEQQPEKELLRERVLDGWLQTDPEQAAAWARSIPLSDSRDRVFAAMVHWLGVEFPPDATKASAWLDEIQAPESRASAYERFFHRWASRDEAGARSWLETANISKEIRAKLLP